MIAFINIEIAMLFMGAVWFVCSMLEIYIKSAPYNWYDNERFLIYP